MLLFLALMAAIAWPAALLKVADVIDNPWNVCANRAKQCGHLLADILLSRRQVCQHVDIASKFWVK